MTNQALLESVQYGDLEAVRAGLEQGLDPNYRDDESGPTLLHWAAQEGYTDLIELLARFGAAVDATRGSDMTALFSAAGAGDLAVVKTLIGCGAEVNRTGMGTALHNAAAYGNADIVDFLVSSGANVNAVDDEGVTPLLYAVSNGHREVADLLVAQGAQKYVTDSDELSDTVKVFNAVLDRADTMGYERLPDAQRVLACVLRLRFEVESQGFVHFYSGPSGDLAVETVSALERVGAGHTAELMRQANALFVSGEPPKERAARVEQLTQDRERSQRLEDLTHDFYEDEDGLRELLDKFVQDNGDQLPNP